MGWEGTCNKDFELTYELLQDDKFVQDNKLQDEKPIHEEKEDKKSLTPLKVVLSKPPPTQSISIAQIRSMSKVL